MGNVTNVIEVFQLYNGGTWLLALFLAALAYALLRADKETRLDAALTLVGAGLIVFNQLAFRVISAVTGTETYYRLLWAIPVIPILAYVTVDLIVLRKGRLYKLLAAGCMAALVAAGMGTPYLKQRSFAAPSQIEYISPSVVDICNIISADKGDARVRVACDQSVMLALRMQDPTLVLSLTRNTYLHGNEDPEVSGIKMRQYNVYQVVNGNKIKPKALKRALRRTKTTYVVIANEYNMDELMERVGCTVLAKTLSHTIYKTQYLPAV